MYMYMYVECVLSEIVCSTLCFHDFVCMHLLLDQFFDDFLKFQKLKQPCDSCAVKGHTRARARERGRPCTCGEKRRSA